jgi:putative methionine-R-sulfoxide reductase with GAF domain/HAMP domain-containing protein
MHHSIRTRLILAFIGLAVGSVSVAAAVLIWTSYASLQRPTEGAAQTPAGVPASVVTLAVVSLILVAVAAGAAAALGLLSVRRMLQPIKTLTEAADAIAAGDLTPRAPVASDDEFGVLSGTFNHMARRLRDRIGTLEQRVSERSRALAAVRDISRLSAAPDERRFAAEVAERVKNAFNYYHVQVFFLDEAGANLILAGATGEAGRKLLEEGFEIPRGKGPAGRAAESNAPVLAADVSQEPGGPPNLLLPKVKSEVAVPIAAEGRVLGVLDAQQVVASGLAQTDVDLLEPIAAQVAAAVRSARLHPPDREPAEQEAVIAAIGRKIDETTTAEDAVRVAEGELARALGSREVHIVLPPPLSSPVSRNRLMGEDRGGGGTKAG